MSEIVRRCFKTITADTSIRAEKSREAKNSFLFAKTGKNSSLFVKQGGNWTKLRKIASLLRARLPSPRRILYRKPSRFLKIRRWTH